jgi:hypothetical protein
LVSDNYAKLVSKNLEALYNNIADGLEDALGAKKAGNEFSFRAFGKDCRIGPHGIFLDNEKQTGVLGILISLYGLHASHRPCVMEPFKAFKEFADTMPYVAAFATHTEQILVPEVAKIKRLRNKIMNQLDGQDAPVEIPGDFTMVLYPLPKIALCYIFYEADEDFQAAVTCLYSGNASCFMPVDGLADVGEYTSGRILEIAARER